MLAGVLALLAAATALAGLVRAPSDQERAADLRAFARDMTADVQSCAGGVREALTALRAIQAGSSRDVATASRIARDGAANCSPANNELLDDLLQYQVTESLARFRLDRVVSGLVTWCAPDAMRVQSDVATVLAARDAAAARRAEGTLRRALTVLDAQRTAVDAVLAQASAALHARAQPLPLPG
ncbi:MAG TPA: hypothetical protein VF204_24805 [Streptosporangiaceae bacterium]